MLKLDEILKEDEIEECILRIKGIQKGRVLRNIIPTKIEKGKKGNLMNLYEEQKKRIYV